VFQCLHACSGTSWNSGDCETQCIVSWLEAQ
jgi:hypothetical protein